MEVLKYLLQAFLITVGLFVLIGGVLDGLEWLYTNYRYVYNIVPFISGFIFLFSVIFFIIAKVNKS